MADTPTDHGELRELIGAYALGALSEREHAAIRAHLRECAECAREAQALQAVAEGLARAVPDRPPPPDLRARVLAAALESGRTRAATAEPAATEARPSAVRNWLLAAASVAAIAIGLYAAMLRQQVALLEVQLEQVSANASAAERQATEAREQARVAQQAMEIIAAPDMARVDLAGQPLVAGAATGRAFWSRSRGLVFTATNLPRLPAGRVYQVWVVPQGAPISMGLLMPDNSGNATNVTAGIDLPAAVAIAVTLEPAGGVPAPTGEKYLVGTL